jgi:hypothetical protein
VTDTEGNAFSLKCFTYQQSDEPVAITEQLVRFVTDRTTLSKVTESLCPNLTLGMENQPNDSVQCQPHHLQLLLGKDIQLFDTTGHLLSTKKLKITNGRGETSDRMVNFQQNMLLPHHEGLSLGDSLDVKKEFKSLVSRYLSYTIIAPQLVDAIKTLHGLGFAHLGLDAGVVLCVDAACTEVVVSDFSRSVESSNKQVIEASPFASELGQTSIRFYAFDGSDTPAMSDRNAIEALGKYTEEKRSFDSLKKVDWFGLGGTLYYIINGQRYYADSQSQLGSRSMASFIIKAFNEASGSLLKAEADVSVKRTLTSLRDHIAEGLLLIDGLLDVDRSKRLSFDSEPEKQRLATNLRSTRLAMSALQTESNKSVCNQYFEESRNVITDFKPTDHLPRFMEEFC